MTVILLTINNRSKGGTHLVSINVYRKSYKRECIENLKKSKNITSDHIS